MAAYLNKIFSLNDGRRWRDSAVGGPGGRNPYVKEQKCTLGVGKNL